jgi:hypothetical protein
MPHIFSKNLLEIYSCKNLLELEVKNIDIEPLPDVAFIPPIYYY